MNKKYYVIWLNVKGSGFGITIPMEEIALTNSQVVLKEILWFSDNERQVHKSINCCIKSNDILVYDENNAGCIKKFFRKLHHNYFVGEILHIDKYVPPNFNCPGFIIKEKRIKFNDRFFYLNENIKKLWCSSHNSTDYVIGVLNNGFFEIHSYISKELYLCFLSFEIPFNKDFQEIIAKSEFSVNFYDLLHLGIQCLEDWKFLSDIIWSKYRVLNVSAKPFIPRLRSSSPY